MSLIKCYSTFENLQYTHGPFPSREKVIPDVDDACAIRQKYFKHKWSDQLSNAVSLTPLPCIFWHNQAYRPDMTSAVDRGRKASTQTNKTINKTIKPACRIINNLLLFFSSVCAQGGGLAHWNLGRRTTGLGVPGSSPGRGAVRCGIEQVTFTPCLVLVKPRKWTYDRLGQTVTGLETTFCLMC